MATAHFGLGFIPNITFGEDCLETAVSVSTGDACKQYSLPLQVMVEACTLSLSLAKGIS